MYNYDLDNPFELYQNQPLLIKLWRRRHLLLVPFYALLSWLRNRNDPSKRRDSNYFFRVYWSIEMGMAHIRMNWVSELLDDFPTPPSVKVNEKVIQNVRKEKGKYIKPPKVTIGARILDEVHKPNRHRYPGILPPPIPKHINKIK